MKALPFLLGAAGGGLAAWAVWGFFQKKLETSFAAGQSDIQARLRAGSASLSTQATAAERQAAQTVLALVNATVPPQVDAAVISTLNSYGITPTMAQKVARLLNALPG